MEGSVVEGREKADDGDGDGDEAENGDGGMIPSTSTSLVMSSLRLAAVMPTHTRRSNARRENRSAVDDEKRWAMVMRREWMGMGTGA